MAYDNNDLCSECKTHFSEPHDIDCSLKDGVQFEPPTEQQIRQQIERIMRRRASAACYWKEEFENMALKAQTIDSKLHHQESAEKCREVEALWNEAADIALGIRKE